MRTFFKTLLKLTFCCILWILFVERRRLWTKIESQSIYDATTDIEYFSQKNTSSLDMKIYYSYMRTLNSTIPIEITDKEKYKELNKYFTKQANDCTKLPEFKDLKFNNLYWQELKLSSGETEYLYKAYYDNRTLPTDNPSIRIIAVLHMNIISNIKFCQIWLPNKLLISEITSVIFDKMPKTERGDERVCVITCKIPKVYISLIPIGVSLLENRCDKASNLLKVNYNLPASGIKEGVAVCVKAFDFPYEDKSMYFIQWLELFDILGFRKVFLYDYGNHPAIKRVFQYYQSLGRVELIPLTIPGTHPNLYGLMHMFFSNFQFQRAIYEKVSMNDCYYMNMNKYKYLVSQDTDEIIIPTNGKSIHETFEYINTKLLNISNNDIYNIPSGYTFNGAVFPYDLLQKYGINPNIPSYMSLLQQIYRRDITKYHKTVLSTEKSLALSTHSPHYCVGECYTFVVPHEIAYIHHYRNTEREALHTDNVINDTSVWSHKEQMVSRVKDVLNALNLI